MAGIGDERVVIRIDVKADTTAIDRVRAKLTALCRQADDCSETFKKLGRALDDAGDDNERFGRGLRNNDRDLKKVNKTAKGFAKFMQTTFKLAMIGSAIETGLLMIALSSVNGLLATGRFLVKSYHVVMSALAKAAAAAGVALATVAAAQRQYTAAVGSGRYGGSFAASSQALRTMSADARLASLGIKSLNAAFATASKNARVTGGTVSAIGGLMDFATLSGDLEKGTQAVANLVSLVQKGGAGGEGVAAAAKEIGPEFEKAFKQVSKGGKATKQELLKAFASGDLAKSAGIAGTYSNVQGSLMGQGKAFLTQMINMFADLGTRFIEPMQRAFAQISTSLIEMTTKLMPILDEFAKGKMIPTLVDGVDKIADFLVTLMRDYVPATQGFFKSMSNFWNKLVGGFEKFGAYLNQFKEASKVMNQFFGKILRGFGRGIKENFEDFAGNVLENKDEFLKFGDAVAEFVQDILRLFKAFRNAFFSALPEIRKILGAIGFLISGIAGLINMLSGLGSLGGLAGYLGPIMAIMGGKALLNPKTRGKFLGRAGAVVSNPLTYGALAGYAIQRNTNDRGTFIETAGDIGTGAALGATGFLAGGKYVIGAGEKIFTGGANLQKAGSTLAQGGRFAKAGGMAARAGGAMANMGTAMAGMGTGQLLGAGALVGAGAVATHVGSNMASDAVYKATGGNRWLTMGTGATTGALTGAATGAALTAWLGPGALAGALVGGFIGSAWGAFNGIMKDRKYKKQAKKAAQQFVDSYSDIVEGAFADNNIDVVRQSMNDFEMYLQQVADSQVKSGTAFKEGMKLWEEELKKFEPSAMMLESRFKDLTQVTGLTEQAVRDLANEADIDLSNSFISLQDIFAATGVAVQRLGEDFNNFITDAYAEGIGAVQTQLDILSAPQVINEQAEALREAAIEGTLDPTVLAGGLQTILQQQLLLSGGSVTDALGVLIQDLGLTSGSGGQFNIPGNVFYGLGQIFEDAQFRPLIDAFFGKAFGGVTQGVAENLISGAAGAKMSFGISKEQLTGLLGDLPPNILLDIAKKFEEGFSFNEVVTGWGAAGTERAQFEKQLLAAGVPQDLIDTMKSQVSEEEKTRLVLGNLAAAATGFKNQVDPFVGAVADFAAAVEKFAGDGGDTASPRRNIVNTLGSHGKLDMMISGKRSVTSGYRTWNLGSMSSDHAAGRAYDLVGQNLGLYQMAVRANGGFAEFHGGASNRHLHVVPNVNSPVGDTAMPYMGSAVVSNGGSNVTTVNMTVNAAPGMDVSALASEVMYRLERETKSRQERY